MIEALTSTAKNSPAGYNARTGFGIVNAVDALDMAGQLEKVHAAGSQAAASATFGGGPAAAPAAPVSPRGISQLVMFVILAIMSLALAAAGGLWLAVLGRPGKGAHAAPGPSGSRYPPDGGGHPGAGGYPGLTGIRAATGIRAVVGIRAAAGRSGEHGGAPARRVLRPGA